VLNRLVPNVHMSPIASDLVCTFFKIEFPIWIYYSFENWVSILIPEKLWWSCGGRFASPLQRSRS
jgi:hypothetical protein